MLFKEIIKLPLSMEQLQEVLSLKGKDDMATGKVSQETMANVSYASSTLRGANFINYVSNLRLSIDLAVEELTKEDKFDLMKAYLNSRMLSEVKVLAYEGMTMLVQRKDEVATTDSSAAEFFMNKAERKEFMEEYSEILERYELFLESILIGLPFCLKEYANTIGKEMIEKKEIEVINDPAFISSNVVSMIVEPDFLEMYLTYPVHNRVKFFDSQWFEPVFNGFSLISIMANHTTFLPFMQSMYSGWMTDEDIKTIFSDESAA